MSFSNYRYVCWIYLTCILWSSTFFGDKDIDNSWIFFFGLIWSLNISFCQLGPWIIRVFFCCHVSPCVKCHIGTRKMTWQIIDSAKLMLTRKINHWCGIEKKGRKSKSRSETRRRETEIDGDWRGRERLGGTATLRRGSRWEKANQS